MRNARWLVLFAVLLGCTTPYTHLPSEPPGSYVRGDDFLRRGDFASAAESLEEYLSSDADPAYRPRAYYQLAQALYGLERYRDALDVLARFEAEFPDQKGPQVPALRGDTEYELGDRVDAILAWEKAWSRSSDTDRQVLEPRLRKAISELSSAEASTLIGQITEPDIAAMLGGELPPLSASAAPAAKGNVPNDDLDTSLSPPPGPISPPPGPIDTAPATEPAELPEPDAAPAAQRSIADTSAREPVSCSSPGPITFTGAKH